MTPAAVRKLALSFPGAHEEPHFERTSFRVGKKIFLTMTRDGTEAMVPVKPVELCLSLLKSDPDAFFSHGTWTTKNGGLGVRLKKVDPKTLKSLVGDAWKRIAPKPPKAR